MNIILIAGLPGSGKTTRAQEYVKQGYVLLDDLDDLVLLNEHMCRGDNIVITDPNFCYDNVRKMAKFYIEQHPAPLVSIHWEFFENSPEKAHKNAERRGYKSVHGFIDHLTKVYKIPENYTPIEIWQE